MKLKRKVFPSSDFPISSQHRFCSVKVEWDSDEKGKQTGVVVLKLNRPEKFNSLTEEVGASFQTHIETLSHRSDLRAIVLTGEGKAFSAGGDLDFLLDRQNYSIEQNTNTMHAFYTRYLSIRSIPVPVIAGR